MDTTIIFTLIGLFLIALISFFIFGKNVTKIVKTKEEKKEEIRDEYRQKLRTALLEDTDDKNQRVAIKKELLRRCSAELSLNIFFDADDIREIILELSRMD